MAKVQKGKTTCAFFSAFSSYDYYFLDISYFISESPHFLYQWYMLLICLSVRLIWLVIQSFLLQGPWRRWCPGAGPGTLLHQCPWRPASLLHRSQLSVASGLCCQSEGWHLFARCRKKHLEINNNNILQYIVIFFLEYLYIIQCNLLF